MSERRWVVVGPQGFVARVRGARVTWSFIAADREVWGRERAALKALAAAGEGEVMADGAEAEELVRQARVAHEAPIVRAMALRSQAHRWWSVLSQLDAKGLDSDEWTDAVGARHTVTREHAQAELDKAWAAMVAAKSDPSVARYL